MFTGLVEEMGTVVELSKSGESARLVVSGKLVSSDAELGASISVNGCCLTVVQRQGEQIQFDVGYESLARTNLGLLLPGSMVNLERALRANDRLGGHYVTGHVDGLGVIRSRADQGEWSTFWFDAPICLLRQMAGKGSIAVDGVSLTLVDVSENGFSVMLVPHTLSVTTLGNRQPGEHVNLETDLLAKYVERQMEWSRREKPQT